MFDLITKREISFPHFEVLLSDTLIPLMSSNSNDVSLMVTLLTNDVKTRLSKYINGWQVPSNLFNCLVFLEVYRYFRLRAFLSEMPFLKELLFYEVFSLQVLGILDKPLCIDSFQVVLLLCKALNLHLNPHAHGI